MITTLDTTIQNIQEVRKTSILFDNKKSPIPGSSESNSDPTPKLSGSQPGTVIADNENDNKNNKNNKNEDKNENKNETKT